MTTKTQTTQTVKVRVLHPTSHPGMRWVWPVGWKPKTDWADGWGFADGSLWSESCEEAALATMTNAPVADVIDVPVTDVVWLSSGDCRRLRTCEVEPPRTARETLTANIRRLLDDGGYTVDQLAEHCRVHPVTVRRWISAGDDYRFPNHFTLTDIAGFFGVDLADLFSA